MVTGSKRKVLAEALYLIRMSLMSEEEFTNGPQKSGLLSNEEAPNLCVSKYSVSLNTFAFSIGVLRQFWLDEQKIILS